MSYQKRIIIFLTVMGVTVIVLLGAFGLQLRSSVDGLDSGPIIPEEIREQADTIQFPVQNNGTSSTSTSQTNTTTTTSTNAR